MTASAAPPLSQAVPPKLTLRDFDFALPPELIAQQPTAERSGSRLLDGSGAAPVDRLFRDLPGLLNAGDLLVFNDTRVIKARLLGRKVGAAGASGNGPAGRDHPGGGKVEVLIERVLPGHEVLAHVRASKSPRAGGWLRLGGDAVVPAAVAAADPADDAEPADDGDANGADSANATVDAVKAADIANAADADAGTARAADATLEAGFDAEVLGRAGPDDALFRLRFPADPLVLLERHGHVPLPPYITHADGADDERRYQTVFAARPGAIAAPTAALHFDHAVLDALRARGVRLAHVTLHVGAGTFQPVRVDDIAQHRMHSEWYEVSAATRAALADARAGGGRIVAVGTTTLRALESAARVEPTSAAADGDAITGDTDIFITPGFEFRVVDALLTNFHLPKSTLLMLISAFAGHRHVMALYRHAIAARYRFFSYGDAMWLERARPSE